MYVLLIWMWIFILKNAFSRSTARANNLRSFESIPFDFYLEYTYVEYNSRISRMLERQIQHFSPFFFGTRTIFFLP